MMLELPTRSLDLARPCVMGVLNLTPDSFSDGGEYPDIDAALARALEMVGEGAAIIDVGGESTRPGAQPVDEQQELERIVPLIERLRRASDCVISIDTSKPVVMDAACAAGAEIINDVAALRAPGAIAVAVHHRAAVCLMHMQGEPRTMQQAPQYADVVEEVAGFLRHRRETCEAAGIARNRILIDPGFGFGKTLAHNLRLMAHLHTFCAADLPVLIGVSRKSFLGQVSGLPLAGRLSPGLAAATLAVWQGVRILRTHDVKETVEAMRFADAVTAAR
jgi:dihydropteroate synthase